MGHGKLSGSPFHIVGRHGDLPPDFYDMPAELRDVYREIRREEAKKKNADQRAEKDKQKPARDRPQKSRKSGQDAQRIRTHRTPRNGIKLGSVVKFWNLDDYELETVILVNAADSDPMEGKISITCPVGKALLGHLAGDVVEAKISGQVVKYKIMEIKKV